MAIADCCCTEKEKWLAKSQNLAWRRGASSFLYQEEEVTAVLDYRRVDMLDRLAWVAIPDWSTIVRK
jgi:hypothetical protein